MNEGSALPEPRLHPSWDTEVQAAARLLGDAYADNADLRKRIDELQAALDTRELVEQAKGVIMGRLDIDAEGARALLHEGANGDVDGIQVAAAAVVAFRRTPAEIEASVLGETG